jgi:hypothetical protein
MTNNRDAIADFYRMYIRKCTDVGIDYDFIFSKSYDKGFGSAFGLRKFDLLSEAFEISIKNRDLFIEVMRAINDEYSFDEVMSIVRHINQVDAFKISLEFVDYSEASDIPNRFICEENMEDILALFPNARNDKTINEVLRLKAIVDEEDFVYEYTKSYINDIGHAPLSYYAYGEPDKNEIKELFPLEEDEEYDFSEEVFLISFNNNFPEELLEKAFQASIRDDFSLQEWYWLSNPNRNIRAKYLEFIAKNEEKVIKICNDNSAQTIVEYILSHKMIDYSDIEHILGLLKKKESIFSEDLVSSIEYMVDDSNYMGDKGDLIDLLENKYNELEKLEIRKDSKKEPKTSNKTTKNVQAHVHPNIGSVIHAPDIYLPKIQTKCKTSIAKADSKKSQASQKSFKKSNLVQTVYEQKPSEIVIELNQAKTRVISKQIIKLTSEPIRSFLIKKEIDNSVINSFIESKCFNSIVGVALFAAGSKIEFNNESVENAKKEVFQEIKIESITSFGNELVDVVKDSLASVINKYSSANRIEESKNNLKSKARTKTKTKKLSDGKKVNNRKVEAKKVSVK